MSGLLGILNIGRRAILAQQAGLSVTGNNIANANTAGYTRQEIQFQSDSMRMPGLGGLGTGVRVAAIVRARDLFADKEVRRESQVLGFWKSQNEIFTRVETLLNDLDSSGVSDALTSFWDGWQQLADQPEDRLARETVLDRGRNLATSISNVAQELASFRRDIDQDLALKTERLNELAGQVASLNERIVGRRGDAPHLEDERDRLLDEMSSLANVSTTFDAQGAATVRVGSMMIVSGMETVSLSMRTEGEAGRPGRGPVWSHDGSLAVVSGGEIGGLMEVRDQVIPDLERKLDSLALGIASEVNQVHREGTDLEGKAGGDFFVLAADVDELDPSGAALAMQMAPAVARDPNRVAAGRNGQPGDNENAIALANLRHARVSVLGSSSAEEYWATFIGTVGNRVREASDRQAEHESALDQFQNLRDASSGVSLDEEATRLIAYEHAYAAAARVIQVADEVTETLLAMV